MDLTPTQLEVASSLAQDDIPFKLRCATCNKLAVGAFRLPCCEQVICGTCQATLPENCPVCDHSPLSTDLCKPNKALRQTVKAFIKTAERKKEEAQQVQQQNQQQAAVSSVQSLQEPASVPTDAGNGPSTVGTGEPNVENDVVVGAKDEAYVGEDVKVDTATNSEAPGTDGIKSEPVTKNTTSLQNLATNDAEAALSEEDASTNQVAPEDGQTDGKMAGAADESAGQQQNGMGFNMNNGFPGMCWNGQPDFSQMMPFANGGMANPMASFPNMMAAMPGFGMDPMTQMYGGFAGGMGTNGGMGMNFNAAAGQGMYGGWNAQNMWNGQVNNNPNAFANSMGNFGPNPGYGYNMSPNAGNFSQMQQQQYSNHDLHHNPNGHYGRGRGRGRGGWGYGNRGRGGYNQQPQMYNSGNQGNYNTMQNQISQQQQSPQRDPKDQSDHANQEKPSTEQSVSSENVDPSNEEKPTPDQSGQYIVSNATADTDLDVKDGCELQKSSDNRSPELARPEGANKEIKTSEESRAEPVKSILDVEGATLNGSSAQLKPTDGYTRSPTSLMAPPAVPGSSNQDHHESSANSRGRGTFRGAHWGRGAFHGSASSVPTLSPVEPKGLGVAGAPTGPRAMREGLASTRGSFNARSPVVRAPTQNGDSEKSTPRSRYRDREDSRSTSQSRARSRSPRSRSRSHSRPRSRSRSHSRSPSRHRSRRHRRHRHRSRSASESDHEREKRRDRKRRQSRYDEDETYQDGSNRSRASTPEESTHRGHHDKDRRGSHKHRSSHRSHRHRSKSHERRHREKTPLAPVENGVSAASDYQDDTRTDGSRSRYRGKDRSDKRRDDEGIDRARERKRSRRDRSPSPEDSDYSSRRETRRQKRDHEPEIPKGPRKKAIEKPAEPTRSKPAEPQKDPHTLEREARDRERLMKEQQRREAMNAGRKTDGLKRRDSRQSSGSGRRVSYKYEDEESHAARAARIEEEREAGRWN